MSKRQEKREFKIVIIKELLQHLDERKTATYVQTEAVEYIQESLRKWLSSLEKRP